MESGCGCLQNPLVSHCRVAIEKKNCSDLGKSRYGRVGENCEVVARKGMTTEETASWVSPDRCLFWECQQSAVWEPERQMQERPGCVLRGVPCFGTKRRGLESVLGPGAKGKQKSPGPV